MINHNDLIKDISDKLNVSGMNIDKSIIELIANLYIDAVSSYILDGNFVKLPNLGCINPSFRRSNTHKGKIVPTMTLNLDIDKEFKIKLLSRLIYDPQFRDNLKISKPLSDDELDYISNLINIKFKKGILEMFNEDV